MNVYTLPLKLFSQLIITLILSSDQAKPSFDLDRSWKRKREWKWHTNLSQQQTRTSENLAHSLQLEEASRGECSCPCLEK